MEEFEPAVMSRTSENYRAWGDGCDAWELMSMPELIVVAEAMPPGASEISHHHQEANQFFYVLTGELTITFDEADDRGDNVSRTMTAGQGISIPAGVRHQAVNEGVEANSFLAIAGPTTTGDRI